MAKMKLDDNVQLCTVGVKYAQFAENVLQLSLKSLPAVIIDVCVEWQHCMFDSFLL